MNVGYGYSITELETKLIGQLKSNSQTRQYISIHYIVLHYDKYKCNYIHALLLFIVNYYLM